MLIRVRLFAGLRERAGREVVELELPDGAQVADALTELKGLTGGTSVVMAVNRQYAAPEARLQPGDEVALIPPVSGGSSEPAAGTHSARRTVHVRVTGEALSLDPLVQHVRDPRAGAVVTFTGVTREVPELQYEAYAEMAERQMAKIAAAAVQRHGLCAAAAEHRVGHVALSEASVVVAVSAPHRAEAFAGAREIIDQIKARAPIWKQEGGEWVKGNTPA
jgi:MoaE-MoaD fusion protein